MDNVFTNAVSIRIAERRTLYRSISNSGRERSQVASPLFYYAEVDLGPMYKTTFKTIQNDIIDTNYGKDAFRASIPHGHTYADGGWAGAPVVASVSGTSLNIRGLTPGTTVETGDYLQFNISNANAGVGAHKVYQIAGADQTADTNGNVTVTLNTSIIFDPPASTPIVTGSNVQFNFIATDIPGYNTIPGQNGNPMYSWNGAFVMREVL